MKLPNSLSRYLAPIAIAAGSAGCVHEDAGAQIDAIGGDETFLAGPIVQIDQISILEVGQVCEVTKADILRNLEEYKANDFTDPRFVSALNYIEIDPQMDGADCIQRIVIDREFGLRDESFAVPVYQGDAREQVMSLSLDELPKDEQDKFKAFPNKPVVKIRDKSFVRWYPVGPVI